MINITHLGSGGSGIPDTLPQAITELQRLKMHCVLSMRAGEIHLLPDFFPDEDTLYAVLDTSTWTMLDLSTLTLVTGGFIAVEDYWDGRKFVAWWFNQREPVPFSTVASTPYQRAIVADGPSAYWPLDDTLGNKVRELMGGHHGTITGGTSVEGIDAPAMVFDGKGGIDIASPVARLSEFTLEVWWWAEYLSPDLEPTSYAFGQSYYYQSIWRLDFGLYMLVMEDGSREIFRAEGGQSQNNSADPAPNGMWHQFVGTYRYEGEGVEAMQVYRDGVELPKVGTAVLQQGPFTDLATTIAASNPLHYSGWRGRLQDIAYYPYKLTSQQIAAHYALRRP